MTKEEKTTLTSNIFKLIIGIILLTTCFCYLHQNPAEKIALYSGFKMVFQKSEIIFYKLIGKDWQLLEQKYKLEDDFQELINFAEEKGCSDRDFLNDLHTTSENFLLEKKDNIANYIAAYRIQYRDFSIKIEQENCH